MGLRSNILSAVCYYAYREPPTLLKSPFHDYSGATCSFRMGIGHTRRKL